MEVVSKSKVEFNPRLARGVTLGLIKGCSLIESLTPFMFPFLDFLGFQIETFADLRVKIGDISGLVEASTTNIGRGEDSDILLIIEMSLLRMPNS